MTKISEQDVWRYSRSFVAWSESPIGFYPGKRWDERLQAWVDSKDPIKWVERQRRWLDHVFTVGPDDRLPYDSVWIIDIGKSGKTMIGAALAQWVGMFSELPGEILIAANAHKQAGVRTYGTLRQSLRLSPMPYTEYVTQNETRWKSGSVARPVPLKAETQAGSDALLWCFDEVWAYTSETALKMFSEAKASPTQNVSLKVVTTYPGYKQDDGPLNNLLDDFFNENGELMPGVERVAGLEDLPCYARGTTFLWWNHDPYPWHLCEIRGKTFLERQRLDYKGRESEYRRIWEARLVSREDTFVHPARWYECEDHDLAPLTPYDQGVKMVIGFDIGVKRDTTACVARAYDPATRRYTLLEHRIWHPRLDPDRLGDAPEVPLDEVFQWLLDRMRRHQVIAIYYDPTHAYHLAQMLKGEITKSGFSTKMVEVEQGARREKADMSYFDLIMRRELRNYPQCADLTQHVLNASKRWRAGGNFRINKVSQASSVKVDAAVADSQACLGVTENIDLFLQRDRRRPALVPKPSPYQRIYMGVG